MGFVCGCGTPGAPLPPSLNLPDRVTDLSATRAGNQVSLTWTMPRRNTDKLPLKNKIDVHVCRREKAGDSADPCAPAGELQLPPSSDGTFSETLPPALEGGAPRIAQGSVPSKEALERALTALSASRPD